MSVGHVVEKSETRAKQEHKREDEKPQNEDIAICVYVNKRGDRKKKEKSINANLSNFPSVREARQFRASHSNRRKIKIPLDPERRANRWRVTTRKIKGNEREISRGKEMRGGKILDEFQ